MLRLTELKLQLDHPAEALRAAILQRLKLADYDLVGFSPALPGRALAGESGR